MSERILQEWATNATLEQKCGVLRRLATMAEQGTYSGADPSEILVDSSRDNAVRIVRGSSANYAWQAPEVISTLRNPGGAAPVGAGYNQALFTLGLLGYWLFTGKDFLVEQGILAQDLPSEMSSGGSLISDEDVRSISCGNVLVKWTSANPDHRTEGTHLLNVFLSTSTNASHASNNKMLYVPRAYRMGQRVNPTDLELFLDLRGRSVIGSIRLNMSYPNCLMHLMQVNSDGSMVRVSTVAVPRPDNFAGTEYVLTVYYDAELNRLYAKHTDTAGRLIGAKDLGFVR